MRRSVFSFCLSALCFLGTLDTPSFATAKEGAVLVIGSVDIFTDRFIQGHSRDREVRDSISVLTEALNILSADARLLDIATADPEMVTIRSGTGDRWNKLQETIIRELTAHAEADGKKVGSVDLFEIRSQAKEVMDLLRRRSKARWPDQVPRIVLSETTREFLGELEDTVRVTYYVSKDLPEPLGALRSSTRSFFEACREAAGDKFKYRIVDPSREATKHAKRSAQAYLAAIAAGKNPTEPVEELGAAALFGGQPQSPAARRAEREARARATATESGRKYDEVLAALLEEEFAQEFRIDLSRRGVDPLRIRVEGEGESQTSDPIYTHVVVEYVDRPAEVFPALAFESLEFGAISAISRIARPATAKVVFYDASEPVEVDVGPAIPGAPPQRTQFVGRFSAVENYLGEFTNLLPTNAKSEKDFADALAEKSLSAIIIATGPKPLSAASVEAIRQAVDRGVAAIVLTSSNSFDVSAGGLAKGIPIEKIDAGEEFSAWLGEWGLRVDSGVLASNQCGQVVTPQGPGTQPGAGRMSFAAVLHARAPKESAQSPLVANADTICLPASSALVLDAAKLEAAGVSAQVIAQSTAETWSVVPTSAKSTSPEGVRDLPGGVGPLGGVGPTVTVNARELIMPKKGATADAFSGSKPVVVLLRKGAEKK